MHGTVNKAIKKLINKNFGEEKWEEIKKEASVDINVFQSNESYEDHITFDLISSASQILDIPTNSMLFESGKVWILDIGLKNYSSIINVSASSFEEFMLGIPNFQTRLLLLYPKMQPPELIVHSDKGSLYCEYYSVQDGLTPFIIGSIHAIGDLYHTKVDLEQLYNKAENGFDSFKISWN